jgi:multidrug transporter EmrE-like cation transporter
MTISTAQLAIGVVYAVFLWIAPDARKPPSITTADFFKMIPAGVCSAGAHASSVFALAAGGVAFGQIVKAAEPAFAAVIGTFVYGKKISVYKWMCLIPIIGGVCLAALKQVCIPRNLIITCHYISCIYNFSYRCVTLYLCPYLEQRRIIRDGFHCRWSRWCVGCQRLCCL